LNLDDESVVQRLRAYQVALDAGEQPDRAGLLARFPEIAEELSGVLDGLELVNQVGPQLHEGAVEDRDRHPSEPVGDFRILQEVGRGGMGVVYEAEQMSLGRRVALKVLPFAAVLDPRYLQRFKNEAQAAAHLHHTNIVPVYAVGCDRGVHYYAMQFIEGPTVAGLIDELKSNGRGSSAALQAITTDRTTESPQFCRAVAHLGIQAADALDYAHESGVIHRDIKPPNLIIDSGGHLWITDFGLASTRNDTGLTVTGDIVGTVRYMSPEQALAKRVPVDHRTDIYSLAVTLYELLTLEQAFPGDDPRIVMQEVAFKEPPRPRALNTATPRELETILLKAMSKDPIDRYATAKDLADDLRRFLEDRPIHARRPGVAKRAAQWARRHKPVVWAAATVFVLAVMGLAIGTVLLARKHDEVEAARRQAQSSYERAERNLEKARRLVDSMLTRVADEMENLPHMEELRTQLLEEALEFHLDFLQQKSDDPVVRYKLAQAHRAVADIYVYLGRPESVEEAYHDAFEVLEDLVSDFPDVAEYQDELAAVAQNLGVWYWHHDRTEEAETTLLLAIALWERGLATTRRKPDPRAPEGYFLLHMSGCTSALGGLLHDIGKPDEAMAAHVRSLAIGEDLVAKDPKDIRYLRNLAGTLLELGHRSRERGRHEEAEKKFRRLLDLQKQIVGEDPSPRNRHDHSKGWQGLGIVLRETRRPDEAERSYKEAISILNALVRDFPFTHSYRFQLGDAYTNLVPVYTDMGKLEEARQAAGQAIEIFRKLVDDHPEIPKYGFRLGRAHGEMARVYHLLRQPGLATKENARSVKILDDLADELGNKLEYRGQRAISYANHAADFLQSDPKRAKELLLKCIAMERNLVKDYPDAPEEEMRLSGMLSTLAYHVLKPAGESGESESAFQEAIKLGKGLVEKHPGVPIYPLVLFVRVTPSCSWLWVDAETRCRRVKKPTRRLRTTRASSTSWHGCARPLPILRSATHLRRSRWRKAHSI
jgi:tetratricopeptide (TPR) repeat protein/tRNA A-37 threonylcarbamoyl transferase component Bud32